MSNHFFIKYLCLSVISFFPKIIYSQTGVGINNNSPTNTLDVNGTVRIRNLNPNIYNPFTDKVVLADSKGILKAVNANILAGTTYEVLFSFNTLPITNMKDSNPNAVATRIPFVIKSQTITLSKEALVQINFSVPIFDVYQYDRTLVPLDGRAKMLRTHLVIDNNTLIRSTNTYVNHSSGSGTGTDPAPSTGYFYNTGSAFIKLSAGTHTVRLEGTCNPYITCNQGGNFTGTLFQATAIFNQ